jgi:hypothetical protein
VGWEIVEARLSGGPLGLPGSAIGSSEPSMGGDWEDKYERRGYCKIHVEIIRKEKSLKTQQ